MTNATVVNLDLLRSVAFGGISATYAPVGTKLSFPVRLICFTNNTDGDVFFSIDGVNDYLFVPANSFKLFDCTTNRTGNLGLLVFATGTQFYVKQSTVATKNAVYIECLG